MADLSERNLHRLAPGQAHRFHPVRGAVSLIDTPEALAEVTRADVVIGCLPQVACPGDPKFDAFRRAHSTELGTGADQRDDDHIAHYYPWEDFDAFPFNAVGLGLNEALLRRLRARAPHAEVILNFGARVGVPVLFDLFEANGYRPEKLQSRIVTQHAGTDISFFVTLEKALGDIGLDRAFSCAFFSDPAGQHRIGATAAQMRLDRGAEIHHEVCTIRGVPV